MSSRELDAVRTGGQRPDVIDPAAIDAGGEAVARGRSPRGLVLALHLIRFGPGVMLVALLVTMTALSPYFLTGSNIQNLGVQTAILAILALGQLLVVVARGVDLSVGSVIAFSALIGVAIVGVDGSGLLLIAAMLLAGVVVGAFNGLLIVKGHLPQPLIVTVATLGVVRGLALIVSDGETTVGLPEPIGTIGSGFAGPIPVPVLVVGGFAVAIHVFLKRTALGRWVYAVGGNPEAAKRIGIPVGGVIFTLYLVSGFMAGLAGVLTAGRTDSATPLAGVGLELDAITAVIIGGASFFGGRGSVPDVIVGALILAVIRNGLDLLGVEPFYQTVAIGLVIIVALELDVIRGRLENRLRVIGSQR